MIIEIHWQLARVALENLPCSDVTERYDRPHNFFYLDPPYYGIKGYRPNFEPKDFEVLAQTLAKGKGTFLISLNDHSAVRRIFGGFKVQAVSLRYSMMRKITSRGTIRGELLIYDY